MKGAGNSDFQLELLEYGFLAEDTDPCATTMKVIIPKLQGMSTGSSNKNSSKVDSSAFANSSDSKLQSSNTSSEQGYITARCSHRCPCHSLNIIVWNSRYYIFTWSYYIYKFI